MHHPPYCLTHHPEISFNITNTTSFRTPPILAHRPFYLHWHTTHVTNASTSLMMACHPRKHVTNANTSPILAGLLRKHSTYDTHASTNSTPFVKFLCIQLSFLALKFIEEIQQFLLSVFIYSLYFLGLLKHFHRSLKNCHRKIKLFQRKLVYLIQKTTTKNLFPNIRGVLVILCILCI